MADRWDTPPDPRVLRDVPGLRGSSAGSPGTAPIGLVPAFERLGRQVADTIGPVLFGPEWKEKQATMEGSVAGHGEPVYGPSEAKDPDPRVGTTPDDPSSSKWRQALLGLVLVCLLPVLALLVAGGCYRLALWLF